MRIGRLCKEKVFIINIIDLNKIECIILKGKRSSL